jgi:hypothetical protein
MVPVLGASRECGPWLVCADFITLSVDALGLIHKLVLSFIKNHNQKLGIATYHTLLMYFKLPNNAILYITPEGLTISSTSRRAEFYMEIVGNLYYQRLYRFDLCELYGSRSYLAGVLITIL